MKSSQWAKRLQISYWQRLRSFYRWLIYAGGRRVATELRAGRRFGQAVVQLETPLERRLLLAAPHPVALSGLNGTNGFQIDGATSGDQTGVSVSSAGDVNGDGFEDVLVGAQFASPGGNGKSGSTYLLFGKSTGFGSVNLASLSTSDGVRFDGVANNDISGHSISGAGDVNGDGFADIIIGAPVANSAAGQAYVVFGKASWQTVGVSLASLSGSDGFRLDGIASGDQAGASVSGAGDVNGDGFDDVIVGAPGASSGRGHSYVVFGKASGFSSSLVLSSLVGTNGFRMIAADTGDASGSSVASAGDVNGDGIGDVIVGAPGGDTNGIDSGEAHVVFGKSTGFAASINLASLSGTAGFLIGGSNAGDGLGVSVDGAGDVDGDGFDDVVLGADLASPSGRSGAGESYVVFGKADWSASPSLLTSALTGSNGFSLIGETAQDHSGRVVSAAGDVDGDGFDDVFIGAPDADVSGSIQAGSGYVVFGSGSGLSASLDLSTMNGSNGFRIDGASASDMAAFSTSTAGDFNGDGFDDLLLGAIGSEEASIVFGGAFRQTSSWQVGGAGPQVWQASNGGAPDFLVGGLDDDWLISDGGADVLIGGEGNDKLTIVDVDFTGTRRLDGGTGGVGLPSKQIDTLELYGQELRLDLTAIPDNRITDIEAIDLTGSGNNTNNALKVNFEEVVNISSTSNTIIVRGDAGDVVVTESGWTFSNFEQLFGQQFAVYTQAAATIKVDADITFGNFVDVVDLTTLDGNNGFRLPGIDADDRSGRSVSNAGDVNGDGFDDIIVGADRADRGGAGYAGEAYVVFGKAGGFTTSFDLASLNGTNGFRILGLEENAFFGSSVSGAGDINGDGFDDVIVGARSAYANGYSLVGASYVIFGKPGTLAPPLDVGSLDGTNGFRINGVDQFDRAGESVSGVGDVNGDGFDDLIVGAHEASRGQDFYVGESYLIFGKASGFAASLNLSSLDGTNGFRLDGIDAFDHSGFSTSGAGDINGDGFEDLIVGAFYADSKTGESYVVFGKAGGFPSALSLGTLDGSDGFRIDAVDLGDYSGFSVSAAGDVNGDGFDDLIVGAPDADPLGKSSAGQSYVIFGKAGGFAASIQPASLDGTNGFRIEGIDTGDRSGRSVRAAGDVNGDGFDDLIVGAFTADANGNSNAGESYVIFGTATGFGATFSLSFLTGTNGFRIDGIKASDVAGSSVSTAGDVNGDGYDDIIIGAEGADPGNNSGAGESYVIFGGNFTGGVETQDGGNGNDNLIANQGTGVVDILIGGRGNDTLRSDGNSDILIGGEGDDDFYISDTDFTSGPRRIDGGTGATGGPVAGFDRIIVSGDGRVLDLINIPDNRITGIEAINLLGASGDHYLILNQQEVLNISSDSNTLIVQGSAGDLVRFENGWTQQANETLFGQVYQVFTKGAATLKIDADVSLSTFNDVVDLSTLNGTNGFRLDGIDASDRSGRSVSDAGDINGDGFDDIIVGAYAADRGTFSFAGESYVVFGQAGGFPTSIDLTSLNGTNGFRIQGLEENGFFGSSASGAGDINGDGFDDLIVGAFRADANGKYSNGASYIIFGKPGASAATLDVGSLNGTNGFRIIGADDYDSFGSSVSGAGDVNGDGFDDLIVGASGAQPGGKYQAGETYVIFGKASGFGTSLDVSTLNGSNGFRLDGIDANDRSGASVSGAGDVNGDGFDDLIVGAFYADSRTGESYVIFGMPSGFSSSLSLSALNGSNGFRIDAVDPTDYSGTSVSAAGDVNGDGFDDVIVGARWASPNGKGYAGQSYVIFGKAGGFAASIQPASLNGADGFRIDGVDNYAYSGRSVSAAGDVNGDGFDDLIVGAPSARVSGNYDVGESYVIYGKAAGFGAALSLGAVNGTNGFRIDGIDAGDNAGFSVSAAGDVNGDGFDDIIVGALGAHPGGDMGAGESYVIFGGNFTGGLETQVGGNGSDNLIANRGAGVVDILIGGRGNDTLRADGNSDILVGGEGDDDFFISDTDFTTGPRRIDGGTGATGGPAAGLDRIIISGDGRVLDLTTIPDNRITGIEIINLNGASGDNLLILNQQEILNISGDTNTLIVQGAAGDYILFDFGWTLQPNETLFGQTYRVFTKGNATLKLDADVTVRTMWMEIDGTTVSEGGGAVTATIRRSGTVGNRTYALSASAAGQVNMPASVVIPDGQSSITFAISAIDEHYDDGNQAVTITAASGGTSVSSTLNVINDDTAPGIVLGTTSGLTGLPGAPFRLLPFATIYDSDAGDLNGFRADVRIVAGQKSYDRLWLLDESGQRLTAGASIILSGVNVGTVTETGFAVRVVLNSNGTFNHLRTIYNRIEYENVGTNVTSNLFGQRTLAMRIIDTQTRIDIAYYNLDVKGNPQINLDTDSGTTAIPGSPFRLLPFATVTDLDAGNLNGFRADVRIVAGRKSYDRIWLLDEAGQRLTAGASIILSGVNVGTVTENGLAVRVTLNSNATLNHLRHVYNRIEFENVGSNVTSNLIGPRTLAMRVIDTDTLFDIAYYNLNVQGRPEINLGTTSGTTSIPGAPFRLLPFATVNDVDAGSLNGYRVDMYFDAGRKSYDRLWLLDENGQRLNNGSAVILNGLTIGTVIETGLRVKVQFNANATFNDARVLYNRIEYENLSSTSNPNLLGTRRLELRVRDTDGNIGSAYYDLNVTA